MANFKGNEPMNVIGIIYAAKNGNGGMLHVQKDQSGIVLHSLSDADKVDLRPWLTPDFKNGMYVSDNWIQKLRDSVANVADGPGTLWSKQPMLAFTATCRMTDKWYIDHKKVWVMDVESITGPGFVMSSRIHDFNKLYHRYWKSDKVAEDARAMKGLIGQVEKDGSLLGTVYGTHSGYGYNEIPF